MVSSLIQTPLEYECLTVDNCFLYSGRQFLQAEDMLFSALHTSYEESLEAGIQCFLLSIDVSVATPPSIFRYQITNNIDIATFLTFQSIMEYGSTQYVGWYWKKMAAALNVYKMACSKV